jgi:hypothetical protein
VKRRNPTQPAAEKKADPKDERIAELEKQVAELSEVGRRLFGIVQQTAVNVSKLSGELFKSIGQ